MKILVGFYGFAAEIIKRSPVLWDIIPCGPLKFIKMYDNHFMLVSRLAYFSA
jgi:hypothetical protein